MTGEPAKFEPESLHVWVAEYDEYGDYWVSGVYASEAKAQADLDAGKFTRITKFKIIDG